MKEGRKFFLTLSESFIGNYRKGVLQPTSPYLIYYDAFGVSSYTDDNVLPYGDKLVDVKSETFDKYYVQALNNYIISEIVLAVKYAIPVLAKVKKKT